MWPQITGPQGRLLQRSEGLADAAQVLQQETVAAESSPRHSLPEESTAVPRRSSLPRSSLPFRVWWLRRRIEGFDHQVVG